MPYQLHKPYSFAYYICGLDIKKNRFVSYMAKNESEDVVDIFYEKINKDVLEIDEYYQKIEPLNLSKDDIEKLKNTSFCEHCRRPFGKDVIKCADHYHYHNNALTGRLRKVLCQSCNLNFRNTRFVPVFAHNLSGYDGQLLCKGLGYDEKPIKIIPSTTEKYISFTKKINNNISIRFVDTFRFMATKR